MADTPKLDFGDYFAAGVAAGLTLIGMAFPFLVGKFRARRDEVDAKLKCVATQLGEHREQLAVLKNEKGHVAQQLTEIKDQNQAMNEKIDQLIIKLMQ